jgi:hypothetical protein
MSFFPSNPQTRKMILVAIVVCVALFGFVFFFISFFTPNASPETLVADIQSTDGISETAIGRIRKSVVDAQKELQEDFYKDLRKYTWTPDASKPGRGNPFIK